MRLKRNREVKNWLIKLTNGHKKIKISCFTKKASKGLMIFGSIFSILGSICLILSLSSLFKGRINEILGGLVPMFAVMSGNMFLYLQLGKKAPFLIRKYLSLDYYPIKEIDKIHLQKAIIHYKLDDVVISEETSEQL